MRRFTRLTPTLLLAVSLLAPASADARHHATAKHVRKASVRATVALGDKRHPRAHAARVLARAAAATCPGSDATPTAADLAQVRSAIVCLHNRIRAQHGLPLLKENVRLRRAASGYSSAMVSERFFDHVSPSGSTMVSRIMRSGFARPDQGWLLGENLAWGTSTLATPAAIMQAWMNSPGHRANILQRGYREVGVGIALGVPSDPGSGATYTTEFGTVLR